MSEPKYEVKADFSEVHQGIEQTVRKEKALAAAAKTRGTAQASAFRNSVSQIKGMTDELRSLHLKQQQGIKLTQDEHRRMKQLTGAIREKKRAVDAAGEATRKMTGQIQTGLSGGIARAKQFAGAIVGVGSAVGGVMVVAGLLKREYEHLLNRQREAAMASMKVGDVRNYALQNLAGFDVGQADSLVAEAAETHSVSRKRLWTTLSTMLSARGNLSDQQFQRAFMETAHRLSTSEMYSGEEIGGAVLDAMKITGDADPVRAMGFVQQVAGKSRVTNFGKAGEQLAKTMSAAGSYGTSQEAAAELFALTTSRSADKTGETSRTGTISFLSQMAEGTTWAGGLTLPAGSFLHRLIALRRHYQAADPATRRALLAEVKGEAATRGVFMDLVRGEKAVTAEFAAISRGINAPGDPRLTDVGESYYRAVEAGAQEPVRRAAQAYRSAQEGSQMANTRGAMAGVNRKGLSDALDDLPQMGYVERKIRLAQYEGLLQAGASPDEAALSVLREVRSAYGGQTTEERIGVANRVARGLTNPSPLGLLDAARGAVQTGLGKEANSGTVELLDRLIEALEQNTEAVRGRDTAPPPNAQAEPVTAY